MARRRLGPPLLAGDHGDMAMPAPGGPVVETASSDTLSRSAAQDSSRPAPARMPPIAHIAGQSATEAALERLADDLHRARAEGRMIQSLSLHEIDPHHLVRDRIVADDAEMAALMTSIAARGQQMPIEVVDLGAGRNPRYGLISGWRRLTALTRLAADDPAFGQVLAVLRQPASAAAAYRAMVEENELRVGLSYYERARIVARAVEQGIFPDRFAALNGLFETASRARKSKIGSFMRIHDALDDVLQFPSAIPERLGLRLVKALESDAAHQALRAGLEPDFPDAASEAAALEQALRKLSVSRAKQPPAGIRLQAARGKIVLSGDGVDDRLAQDLAAWLAQRLP